MSYLAEVVLVAITPPEEPAEHDNTVVVLYCDTCHRWGRPGTTHLCGETWAENLSDLIASLIAEQT